MSEPPINGPIRPGRRVDPGNLPGRRARRGFFSRLFGRRPQPTDRPEPPREPPYEPPPTPTGPFRRPPEQPPEEQQRYEPERFSPVHEFFYGNAGRGLTPEEDQEARDLYRRGFMSRGPGSKQAKSEFFNFTGMDPRNFDWESWREAMGS